MPSAIALNSTELLGPIIDALCEGITLCNYQLAAVSEQGTPTNGLRFDKRETASITGVAGGSSPIANCFKLFLNKSI